MILYISTATSYNIYNDLFNKNLLAGGYQSQRFNYNLIRGLSKCEEVTSLSALPYIKVNEKRKELQEDNIKYICVSNRKDKLHKINNVLKLFSEGKRTIKKHKTNYIICDAFSISPAISSFVLSKIYKIPAIAIVTDVPGVSCGEKEGIFSKITLFFMKKFNAYVFLTKGMNEIINTQKRPYMIMEGSFEVVDDKGKNVEKNEKKICLYGGAFWKNKAGLEYLIDGFLKANIPDAELHLYGMGKIKNYIIEKSQKHPTIKYMGCITNEELLIKQKQASLLINPRPSDNEFCKYSFPSKTFEYMASGTPVLMTRLSGIPDEYYKYVFTIDKENADGICENLKYIFSLPESKRQEVGTNAKDYICSQKNNNIQSKRIYNFLKTL